ncbi:MAG: response regulator transcription factor [Candidatus Anaerobiospirillum merdipullorum]|uniref:Phosphate regulon transcriptional regulatory protein PhoB n=1 Tax=Candidatus Anaerobiospirillum merdipullorum TaxID=2838450 RepID=A0A9E2KQ47_9GAMM|nr:response regulator transcription factor [Candidatus Anaerobiospirillum merdipullorum]
MIYCVEDDVNIREIEIYTLQSMGFDVAGFADGKAFFEALEQQLPDLVLLDVMLPDLDGIQILKMLRQRSRTKDIPVIMATARSAEFEKIQALDLGADDYLAKPFSMMEMTARVKAVLRRTKKNTNEGLITIGALTIDKLGHQASLNGTPLELTLKEYELLLLLCKSCGRAFSREQILDVVWGTNYDGETRTVDVHIKTLRQKLKEMGHIIKTVRGVGYKAEYDDEV